MAESQLPIKRAKMMNNTPVSSRLAGRPTNRSNFPRYNGKNGVTGSDYLQWTSDLVSKNKHKTLDVKNPAGATWTWKIGGLDDTIYSENVDEVKGWDELYLPKKVSMQVVGVVEGTSCPYDQLVLMTCDDQKMYVFDGEELHYVALSLEQLSAEGITYPASERYYKGDALKHMTEEDWAKVKKRLDQAHYDLMMSKKSRFLANLRSTRNSTGVTS